MLRDLEVKRNRRHSRPLAPPAPGCPHSHPQLHNHTSNNTHTHRCFYTWRSVLWMCSRTIYSSFPFSLRTDTFMYVCTVREWRSLGVADFSSTVCEVPPGRFQARQSVAHHLLLCKESLAGSKPRLQKMVECRCLLRQGSSRKHKQLFYCNSSTCAKTSTNSFSFTNID